MLVNVTALKKLIIHLNDEFYYQKKIGRSNSQIKIRIDCVLSGLTSCIGSSIVGEASDYIVNLDDLR